MSERHFRSRQSVQQQNNGIAWLPVCRTFIVKDQPIAFVDRSIAVPPIPMSTDKPSEAPIAPGLRPPPASAAPARK